MSLSRKHARRMIVGWQVRVTLLMLDWREWADARAAGEGGCGAQENGREDASGERTTQEDAGFHVGRPTCSRAD